LRGVLPFFFAGTPQSRDPFVVASEVTR
jgi:hypothetical protein